MSSDKAVVEVLWLVPTATTWETGDRFIACGVKYPSPTAQSFREFNALRGFGLVSLLGLEEGDCFADVDLGRQAARAVPCDSSHSVEVIGVMNMAAGPFPGDQAVADEQNAFCASQILSYVGGPLANGQRIQSLYPFEDTWTQIDDRAISCVVFLDEPVRGSIRGTGGATGSSPAAAPGGLIETDLFGGDLSLGILLGVGQMTSSEISLDWRPVPDATSYELFRIDEAAMTGDDPRDWEGGQSLYQGPELSFVDTSVTAGQSYAYYLVATRPDGSTNPQWRAAQAIDDTEPPSSVGTVSALRAPDGLLLQWSESVDNNRFAVYEIFRGLNGAEPEYYATVWNQGDTVFVDPQTPPSGDAVYRVVAIDLHENESEPAELTFSFG